MCILRGQMEGTPEEETGIRTIDEAIRHAGGLMDVDCADDIARAMPDFLWIYQNSGKNVGYCTNCGARVEDARVGHRTKTVCTACGKTVEARLTRYGHKSEITEIYYAAWRKSAIDENVLVMVGFYAGRDYRGSRPEASVREITPVQIDVFRYGDGAARFQRSAFGNGWQLGTAEWHKRRDVRAIGAGYYGHQVPMMRAGFHEAIAGGPFARVWAALEMGGNAGEEERDHCEAISAIARRPWIEYMAKAGFLRLARRGLVDGMDKLINRRGKRGWQVLRLSPGRYGELRQKGLDVTADELALIQTADRGRWRMRTEEIIEIARMDTSYDHGLSGEIFQGQEGDEKTARYLLKLKRRGAGADVMGVLRDYYRDVTALNLDATQEVVKYPRDLYAAHQRTTELLLAAGIDRNRFGGVTLGANEGIAKRLPGLRKKFCFEAEGLILRPAESVGELIKEGSALCHCVATYASSYADGRTVICVLRRAEAPDVPWRTVELDKAGRVVQDRGFRNDRESGFDTRDAETKAMLARFWAAWEEKRRKAA